MPEKQEEVHAVLSGYILILILFTYGFREQIFKRMIIVYLVKNQNQSQLQNEKKRSYCFYSYVDKLTKNTYMPVSAT
jgi:hypothetical protein